VNDTAFRSGHGLESNDVAGRSDLGGDLVSHVNQGAFPAAAVTLNVHREDEFTIGVLGDEDVEEVLQCVERFAAAPDEDCEFVGNLVVFSEHIEDLRDQSDSVTGGFGVTCGDTGVRETKDNEQVSECATEEVDLVLWIGLDRGREVGGSTRDLDFLFGVDCVDGAGVAGFAATAATRASAIASAAGAITATPTACASATAVVAVFTIGTLCLRLFGLAAGFVTLGGTVAVLALVTLAGIALWSPLVGIALWSTLAGIALWATLWTIVAWAALWAVFTLIVVRAGLIL
jgi:hypothetical protein